MKTKKNIIKKICVDKKKPEYQAGHDDGYKKAIEDYKKEVIKYFSMICVAPEIENKEQELMSWENKYFLFGMENPFTMKDLRRILKLKTHWGENDN